MMSLKQAKKIKKRLVMLRKGREQGYVKNPTHFSFKFLIDRLKEEVVELELQLQEFQPTQRGEWMQDTLFEIADVSNIADFIYGKLRLQEKHLYKSGKV